MPLCLYGCRHWISHMVQYLTYKRIHAHSCCVYTAYKNVLCFFFCGFFNFFSNSAHKNSNDSTVLAPIRFLSAFSLYFVPIYFSCSAVVVVVVVFVVCSFSLVFQKFYTTDIINKPHECSTCNMRTRHHFQRSYSSPHYIYALQAYCERVKERELEWKVIHGVCIVCAVAAATAAAAADVVVSLHRIVYVHMRDAK